MGFFSKLFGKGDDSDTIDEAPVSRPINIEARRSQLTELSAALSALRLAMLEEGNPVNNPGWMGRVRDFAGARHDADQIAKTSSFTHDQLNEVLCSVRPLFRGEAPPEYQHLQQENQRVVEAIEALYAPADGE